MSNIVTIFFIGYLAKIGTRHYSASLEKSIAETDVGKTLVG
jgi:hypothetical protein